MNYAQNRVIALLLCLVVCIAVGSGLSFRPHEQAPNYSATTKDQPNTSTDTQKEKSDSAIARYTLWLMVFTGILAGATIGLGILTVNQLRLGRTEFVATHRPKLRIRRIFLREPLAINQTIKIRILAANIGANDATINGLGLAIYVGDAVPNAEPRPYPEQRIPAGKWAAIDGEGPVFSIIESTAFNQGNILHAIGTINYGDANNIERATAFARSYDLSRKRFVPLPDTHPESDREYED
jgi:hypothetical protein